MKSYDDRIKKLRLDLGIPDQKPHTYPDEEDEDEE
jgi:hypothetical protein